MQIMKGRWRLDVPLFLAFIVERSRPLTQPMTSDHEQLGAGAGFMLQPPRFCFVTSSVGSCSLPPSAEELCPEQICNLQLNTYKLGNLLLVLFFFIRFFGKD